MGCGERSLGPYASPRGVVVSYEQGTPAEHTHTHTHTFTHTHTHPHSHSNAHSHSHSQSQSHSLTLTLTLTTHSHSHSHSHTLTSILTLAHFGTNQRREGLAGGGTGVLGLRRTVVFRCLVKSFPVERECDMPVEGLGFTEVPHLEENAPS